MPHPAVRDTAVVGRRAARLVPLSRGLLRDEDLRLSYRDRVRPAVLDGRLEILAGRADEGIAALRRLGRQAAESPHLDLAAHVWQSLATTLADVRS